MRRPASVERGRRGSSGTVTFGFLALCAFLVWGQSADAFRNVAEGAPAPGFALTGVSGEKVSLQDFAGKPLVMAFVRQGQDKSTHTLGDLAALRGGLPGGAAVVAVVLNPSEGDVGAWAKTVGADFPILLDETGQAYGAYGVLVVPSTGVVAADGAFRGEVSGHTAGYRDDVENLVRVALGQEVAVAAPESGDSASAKSEERKTAERHLEQAKILVKRRMVDKGVVAAKEAAAADPSWSDAQVLVGELLLDQSDENAAEALPYFQKALELSPKDAAAKAGLARVKSIQGDHEGAIAVLSEAVLLNPRPERLYYQLGLVYERAGQYEKAVEAYRKALERLLQ